MKTVKCRVKNTVREYVAVRVQLVRVRKRRLFGWKDQNIRFMAAIPNTAAESVRLYEKLKLIIKEFGIELKLAHSKRDPENKKVAEK